MKGSHSQDMDRQQYSNNDDLAASSQIAFENQLQDEPNIPEEDEEHRARHDRHKKRKSKKEPKSRSERHAQRKESGGQTDTIDSLMENMFGPPQPYPQTAQSSVSQSTPAHVNTHAGDYGQHVDPSSQMLPPSSVHEPQSTYSSFGGHGADMSGQDGEGFNASPSAAVAEKKKRKKRAAGQDADSLAHTASAANALIIDPALTGGSAGAETLTASEPGRDAVTAQSEEAEGDDVREGSVELGSKATSKRKRSEGEKTDKPSRAEKRSKTSKGSKKKSRETDPAESNDQESATSGPFTKYEIDQLTDFFEKYRLEHDMSQFELNEKIQATNRGAVGMKDDFWTDVANVLPYRTRQSIYKVCRRRFHNFGKRGQWTAEEDERLRLAQTQKPNRWKAIGEMIGRMPEDCRDRWRNYLKCGDHMNKDIWTEQEERSLRKAIEECITAMQEAKIAEKAAKRDANVEATSAEQQPETFEDLVNWSIVSDKMGGTRSRLQCLYKWKKLKVRDAEEERKARLEAEGVIPSDRDRGPKITWRVKQAEQKIAKMLPGDKFHLLQSISESGTYEEKNIPWKIVGSPEFRAIWSTTDRKWAFHKMKQTAPELNQLSLQDMVLGLMDRLIADHPTELGERYIPSTEDEEAAAKKRRKKKLSTTVVEDEALGDDHDFHSSSQHHFDTSMGYDNDDDEHVNGASQARTGHARHDSFTDDVVDPSLRGQHGGLDSTQLPFVDGVDREMAQRVRLLRGV
ncbi:hypothetical protein L228DRAFT_160220 [Xylona heveae TC161]|uniref:DNA-binding protein REB1 n=1 Tax=Xylona heveae (strain CBS 132557 / TC161) TaxID=1328760 RepID=A0A165G6K6_XYLHT|nr:hypothetical protein L228DRAFT_160220 [Xylona heveae TC161]KZF21798.1 hypothetical protein L228DRAFT_160220 [Xylona heveae TC161]